MRQIIPICTVITKRHLIRSAIYMHDLQGNDGTLPAPNLLNEYLNYTINCDTIDMGVGDTLWYKIYFINDRSRVIMLDDTVGNGVVHVIDHIIDSPRK